MNGKKHYYSLKCKGNNAFNDNGQVRNFIDRIVNIGDTQDCDIRYECGEYEPEYYATILKNDNGDSWRIVQRNANISISVQGKGDIGYVHQLEDGDIIKFEGQDMLLQFKEYYDANYNKVRGNNFLTIVITVAVCFLFTLLFIFNTNDKTEPISESDVEKYEESIYLIKVDSVQQILEKKTEDGKKVATLCYPTNILTDNAPVGTAFLTVDGTIITARHCVEYWLGYDLDLTRKVSEMYDDDVVKWAIETETFNLTHDAHIDGEMKMCVYFSLYDFMGNYKTSLSSCDPIVHMNKDQDGIFEMADFSVEPHYWRSIRPYFENTKMSLGDILWIDKIDSLGVGSIAIASDKNVKELNRRTQLMICGYPQSIMDSRQVVFTSGVVARRVATEKEPLFIEANLNHGFSGAPVLAKINNGIVAVGVISRVDSISSGLYKLAVPVTQIKCNEVLTK